MFPIFAGPRAVLRHITLFPPELACKFEKVTNWVKKRRDSGELNRISSLKLLLTGSYSVFHSVLETGRK